MLLHDVFARDKAQVMLCRLWLWSIFTLTHRPCDTNDVYQVVRQQQRFKMTCPIYRVHRVKESDFKGNSILSHNVEETDRKSKGACLVVRQRWSRMCGVFGNALWEWWWKGMGCRGQTDGVKEQWDLYFSGTTDQGATLWESAVS